MVQKFCIKKTELKKNAQNPCKQKRHTTLFTSVLTLDYIFWVKFSLLIHRYMHKHIAYILLLNEPKGVSVVIGRKPISMENYVFWLCFAQFLFFYIILSYILSYAVIFHSLLFGVEKEVNSNTVNTELRCLLHMYWNENISFMNTSVLLCLIAV